MTEAAGAERNARELGARSLVFITGVEGSGTTVLLELVSRPRFAVAAGGNYWSSDRPGFSPREMRDRLNELTLDLWRFPGRPSGEYRARLVREINGLAVPPEITHVAYKRSYPFLDGEHFPELTDIRELGSASRVVVMWREPARNARSMLRRRFVDSIAAATNRTRRARELLQAQVEALRIPYLHVQYERLIEHPEAEIERVESFLDYPARSLLRHTSLIKRPTAAPLADDGR